MGGLQHKPTPEFLDVWPVWSTLKFVEALPDSRVACVEVHEGMVRPPHASAPRSPAPSRRVETQPYRRVFTLLIYTLSSPLFKIVSFS